MSAPADIAVVITCFNLGRTLEESVASVRAQSLEPRELIIVDDGSTEPLTLEVLLRLEHAGERIERTNNQGVSAARNHGARKTHSTFLVFLDADDAFEANYFELAMARLTGDPELDFVSSGQRGFGAADYEWSAPQPSLPASIAHGVVHISSVMRREVFEAVGGWREGLEAYEELDFWTSVMAEGFTGVVIEAPLLRYRVRPDSMWHQAIEKESHLRLMGDYYDRHWPTIEAHGRQLLLAKEQFILDQRQHQRHLVFRQQQVEAELDGLQQRIEILTKELQSMGSDRVDWGELRRLEPLSPNWGLDRGRPLDRYYIEAFLERHGADVAGDVIEIKDPWYTQCYGGESIRSSSVLDIDENNAKATIVADLAAADQIPPESFDCFILTQTLNIIFDVREALKHAIRVLRPGGVLLVTVSALNRISYEDGGLDGDYWRFTEAALRRLFSEVAPVENIEITGYGNVLACTALLHGLAIHELTTEELDVCDPYYPLIYGIRVVCPPEQETAPNRGPAVHTRGSAEAENQAAILAYHRISEDPLDPYGLCVSPDVFRRQMEELRDAFTVLPLSELIRHVAHGAVPKRAIALTFDDAYVDNLGEASGILVNLGLPATFFVTNEGLHGHREFWWDTLNRVFLGDHVLPNQLTLEVGGRSFVAGVVTDEDRRVANDRLWELMAPLRVDRRERLVNKMLQWSGLERGPIGDRRPMISDELLRLAATPGMEIGAHSAHHRRLIELNLDECRREILDNRDRLEDLLGCQPALFAYPFGEADQRLAKEVRNLGFEGGVTMGERLANSGSDRMLLPRIEIKRTFQDSPARRLETLFSSG